MVEFSINGKTILVKDYYAVQKTLLSYLRFALSYLRFCGKMSFDAYTLIYEYLYLENRVTGIQNAAARKVYAVLARVETYLSKFSIFFLIL